MAPIKAFTEHKSLQVKSLQVTLGEYYKQCCTLGLVRTNGCLWSYKNCFMFQSSSFSLLFSTSKDILVLQNS